MKRYSFKRSDPIVTALALALDRKIGDPDNLIHPVAYFGHLANLVEKKLYKDSYLVGAVSTTLLVGVCVAFWKAVSSWPFGAKVLLQYFCISDRQLRDVVADVVRLVEAKDLQGARRVVGQIVGRSTSELSEAEVLRAAFESLAENSSDGAIAPIFYGALLGEVGAIGYRAINTLDSMFGHKSERYLRFGYASARLDDLVNLLPSRLTWLCAYVLSPKDARMRIRRATSDAKAHPSPNAGVVEACFAGRFDVGVGGVNLYDGVAEERIRFGGDREITTKDLKEAIGFESRVVELSLFFAMTLSWCLQRLIGRWRT